MAGKINLLNGADPSVFMVAGKDVLPMGTTLSRTRNEQMNKPKQLEDLRGLYRAAFEEWALQVGRLDRVRESAAESSVLEEAQDRTTAAEAGYRDTRNRLADEMAGGTMSVDDSERQRR